MIRPQDQAGSQQAAVEDVCPHCGAILAKRRVELPAPICGLPEPVALVWQPTMPDFPPPPGCRRVWVPFRGYLDVDDDIRKRVDRFFNVPMLTLAILVLPLLVVDYYVTRGGEGKYPRLAIAVMCCHVALSVAFLAEFIVKIRIAQSRLSYLTRNWIDLIIIVLPFLRPFRILRAMRLYAVRGVGLKAFRTMVPLMLGLRFTQRFHRSSDATVRADYSKWPRAALVFELERMKKRLSEMEQAAGGAGARLAKGTEEPGTDANV